MITLYFFGTAVEGAWGGKKFLAFYLVCGVVGGLLFLIMSRISPSYFGGVLIGASGGIMGIFAAGWVLFPQMKVWVFFLFNIPIRLLVVLMVVGFCFFILTGQNAGGELAHLGGLAAGFGWIYTEPRWGKLRLRRGKGAWERKLQRETQEQAEVDRILEKVHQQGLHSLSRKEKHTLQRATAAKKKTE